QKWHQGSRRFAPCFCWLSFLARFCYSFTLSSYKKSAFSALVRVQNNFRQSLISIGANLAAKRKSSERFAQRQLWKTV
ncbi:MAG: hypothetical protein DCC59_12280, partial [Chloroflexi bacterium]